MPDASPESLESVKYSQSEASNRLGESPAPKGDSLEDRLQAIDLNALQSKTESREPRSTKLSARDLLERRSGRRLDIHRIKFTGDNSTSKGGHGEVTVATLVPGDNALLELERKVAVKKLQLSDNMDEEKFLRTFVNELRLVDGLTHPNIVEIIGFVEDIKRRIAWLVFPWEANGNVREFLRSGEWEIPERVSLIKDVASGLKYLHGRQPPICHGDLKSLNILVNSEHRAVITDFGSARAVKKAAEPEPDPQVHQADSRNQDAQKLVPRLEVTLSDSEAQLTITGPSWSFRWAAPEVLNKGKPTLASDIWALGWIAWEIVTDNYPFPETNTQRLLAIKIIKGFLPSIYKDGQLSQIQQLCYLMVRCWKPEPKERPSAAECRSALEWIPSIVPMANSDVEPKIRSPALLLQIGEIHRLQGRNEEAVRMFEQGLAIAQFAGDRPTTANALQKLGYTHQVQSRYAKAESYYAQASEIYKSIGNELGLANTSNQLGRISQAQCRYSEAEESYAQALDIFTGIGSCSGRAEALLGLGNVNHEQSRYAKAESYYTQALEISKSIGNEFGWANALQQLGKIRQTQYRYFEAEKLYTQALDICTGIGYGLGRANALQGLGDVDLAHSRYIKAEGYYIQALEINETLGNKWGQANSLHRLGEINQKRAKYVEAERLYTQALGVCTDIGLGWGRANAFQGLGEIRLAQSSHTEAEKYCTQALEIYRSIGNEIGLANAIFEPGKIHQARSNYAEAEALCTNALAIHTSIGNDLGRSRVLLKLGEIQVRNARYPDAKPFLKDAAQIAHRIGYEWGKNRSKELLAVVNSNEELSTKTTISNEELSTKTIISNEELSTKTTISKSIAEKGSRSWTSLFGILFHQVG